VSARRAVLIRRAATVFSSTSPAPWPYASLTSPTPSRLTTMIDGDPSPRSARRSAESSASANPRRFTSPVRES
jgi:hypothetical protein